jgi:transglutaminase-like putative cysteine protease
MSGPARKEGTLLYKIRHETRYTYSEDVSLSHSLVTFKPRTTDFQQCLWEETWIEPAPSHWDKRRDALGNWVGYFSLEERHRQLTIACQSQVEMKPSPIHSRSPLSWEQPILSDPRLYQFRYPSPLTPPQDCLEYARSSFSAGVPAWQAVLDLMSRIHRDFRYLPGSTLVSTPVSQVMAQRKGVCQDFAHIMLACLRGHGLAARYVSGYLLTTPPPGQARLLGADASHAWVSVWLPTVEGGAWVDLDPTNNCLCDQRHVVLAWGRDYLEVAPVRGVVLGGGRQQVRVAVDVTPLETHRPT